MTTSKGFQQSVYLLSSAPPNLAAITVAAITAGEPLHDGLPAPVNFSATDNQADTSVIGSRQDRSEPGTITPTSLAIEPWRNAEGQAVIDAITPDNEYWLVKFEGGNIAAGDHGTVAAGDTYDVVKVVAGSPTDVDTPRPEARRKRIAFQIAGDIVWDGVVAA